MPSNEANESEKPEENDQVRFRGGFSTSIHDSLFEEHGHSDCCVLTCCGILLYDRNIMLLTDDRPSWKRRCIVMACLSLLFLLFLGAMVAASYLYAYEREHLKELGAEGKRPTKGDVARMDRVHTLASVANFCRIVIWVAAVYLMCKAAQYRYKARRFLMAKMYEERNPYNEQHSDEAELGNATAETRLVAPSMSEVRNAFLQAERCNTCCATAPFGCISKDAIVDPANLLSLQGNKGKPTDLCHCLWKTLTSLCCGACCSCWCQCLGLCAIAQEDRELQRMLPKVKFQVDYITFQPFAEYYPKLEALRRDNVDSMLAHFSELSKLSHNLCQALFIALTFLTVLALTGFDPLLQPVNLLVVFATFLQAFFILYLVHWMWNRFDLSFDAVVKYFASGFILCTANAFVYETFASTTVSFVVSIVRALLNPASIVDDDTYNADDAVDDNATDASLIPIWLIVLMAFLNAFCVTAMVEEISKYFGFWMVEHPDLIVPESVESDASTTDGAAVRVSPTGSGDNTAVPRAQRPLQSLGAGITVAMVTTAVGFACCENFMYVFVYSRTTAAKAQLVTLIARSVFPVHPLAAAIQSIGVCRRDLERDSSMKFGRIIFPSLLLHGCFDFALMFMDLQGKNAGTPPADDKSGALDDPSIQEASAKQVWPALISSVVIVLLAAIFYVVKALAQRKRLEELDKRRRGIGEYAPLLS